MTSTYGENAEQWANRALLCSSWQRSEEQVAIRTINNLLRRQITPQIAAATIATSYEARVKSDRDDVWFLWTALCDAIHHLGDTIENLVLLAKMVRCISKLPNVLDENGDPIIRKTKAQMYWRDVPRFAYCFSETAIEYPYLEDLDRGLGLKRDSTFRKLLNANVFGALYLLELDPDGSRYDFQYTRNLARDHLMFALELASETHNQVRRTEIFLPPAAMWILIAGRNIHKYCELDMDYQGEDVYQCWVGGEHGSELTFLGKDGYSIDRWTFWRTRFEQISVLEGLDSDVMQYAIQAAESMKKIEQEPEVA
ncbi:MAG: hypothetical protein Q9224_003684 [Gallowayella concinna]